jgi:hypothetical protein
MPDFLLRKDTGELEVVTGTEPFVVTPIAGGGVYDVYRLDNGGNVTLTVNDTQAPVIANMTAELSSNEVVLEWTTNEASGSTYWVCTTQVATPLPAQIFAGQNQAGETAEASGVQAVTDIGAQSTLPINGLLDGESYVFHLVQQDASGNISNTLSITTDVPNPDDIAPALRYLTVTPQNAMATLSLSTDEANGALYWVLSDSASAPDAAQIIAGLGFDGATPVSSGTQPVTQSDAQPPIAASDLSIGSTYYFHVLHRDAAGNDSRIESISFVVTDTQGPVLSDVTAVLSGTTVTLNWSTDDGTGTGYWVCSTSPTVPTNSQIISGHNHTGASAISSGMHTVANPGVQSSQVVTGLTEGETYFFHLLHLDAIDNPSLVASTTGVTVSSASAVINIVERSYNHVAPEGIFFDITLNGFDTPGPSAGDSYDQRLHELYYYWEFGDPGTFSNPQNLPEAHKISDHAYGPTASHTYRMPGSYIVSCLVVEPSSGKSAIATTSVNVGNPDAFFPGTNTIFVDTTGTGEGAPPGAIIQRNLGDAINIATGQTLPPKRIMLRRGQTSSFSGTMLRHVPTLHIVAQSGAGPKPIVVVSGQTLYNNLDGGASQEKDFVVQGIDWRGASGWDASSLAAPNSVAQNCFQCIENGPQLALFDQNDFDGFQIAILVEDIGGTNERINLISNDNFVTNWADYAFYGKVGNLALTGNRFMSHIDALSGNGADGVQGGAVRMQAPRQVILHSNDFFSNAGWTNNIGGYFISQPAVRCLSAISPGIVYNMQANGFDGGLNCISFSAGPPAAGRPINALVEKNFFLGNHQTIKFADIQYGGITLRNNICIMPDVKRLHVGFNPRSFFDLLNTPAGAAENLEAPIRIYNNTFVNLMSSANAVGTADSIPMFSGAAGSFSGLEEANNIVHQPNLSPPATPDGPLQTVALWNARYLGYSDPSTPRDPATRTPVDTPALYRPTSTSDALGDALNEPVAFDDFFGNPRPQYPSRGALEMP